MYGWNNLGGLAGGLVWVGVTGDPTDRSLHTSKLGAWPLEVWKGDTGDGVRLLVSGDVGS